MKKIAIILLGALLIFNLVNAQYQPADKEKKKKNHNGIGLKAGSNWSFATANQSGISTNNRTGYMAGIFLSRGAGKVVGYRTELIYSHQGYSFDNGGINTNVLNDYLYLPQLTTVSIGKFFQLQFGAQVGLLLNAKKTGANQDSSISDLMNKIDYGFAGGIELNPIGGLVIGGRYNLGLGKMYKQYEQKSSGPGQVPMPFPLPFNPQTTNFKNGIIQIFIGYKF